MPWRTLDIGHLVNNKQSWKKKLSTHWSFFVKRIIFGYDCSIIFCPFMCPLVIFQLCYNYNKFVEAFFICYAMICSKYIRPYSLYQISKNRHYIMRVKTFNSPIPCQYWLCFYFTFKHSVTFNFLFCWWSALCTQEAIAWTTALLIWWLLSAINWKSDCCLITLQP